MVWGCSSLLFCLPPIWRHTRLRSRVNWFAVYVNVCRILDCGQAIELMNALFLSLFFFHLIFCLEGVKFKTASLLEIRPDLFEPVCIFTRPNTCPPVFVPNHLYEGFTAWKLELGDKQLALRCRNCCCLLIVWRTDGIGRS